MKVLEHGQTNRLPVYYVTTSQMHQWYTTRPINDSVLRGTKLNIIAVMTGEKGHTHAVSNLI